MSRRIDDQSGDPGAHPVLELDAKEVT